MNFVCLINNCVSVIVLSLGFIFHKYVAVDFMDRRGNLHGKGFEKNASVDPVAYLESSGIPSKKIGSRSAASAIHKGSDNINENAQNIDFLDNQRNISRNKSQRSRGSGDGKQGVGLE